MELHVHCEPGFGGEPEPAEIWFGARRVAVREIVDRWWGTGQRWWKLQTDEGCYVLRREAASGDWVLAAVTRDGP
jgi:hypothetical protein